MYCINDKSFMSKEYFYHSFPRIAKGESVDENKERSIQILSNIIDNGLLITPEILNLPFELQEGEYPLMQHRCCFTLIKREQLNEHCDQFGQYSIEWETGFLKKLGVMPVIYLPLFDFGGKNHMELIASKWLYRLIMYDREQAKTLHDATIEAKTGFYSQDINNDEKRALYFKYKEEDQKKGWFEALKNLIYPIDFDRYTDENGYYRQREWKLSGNIVDSEGKLLAEQATQEQAGQLIAMNPSFFTKPINYLNKEVSRAELSLFVKSVFDKHILEHANKIIVPENEVDTIQQLINKSGLRVQVESL